MAISEFEIKRCERELKRFLEENRPPPHIRPKLDLDYRIKNQSVEIFEIRPDWKDPELRLESPVAKTTYVKKEKLWKIYWLRSDLKWHKYDPVPTVERFEDFLTIVSEDQHACFFG